MSNPERGVQVTKTSSPQQGSGMFSRKWFIVVSVFAVLSLAGERRASPRPPQVNRSASAKTPSGRKVDKRTPPPVSLSPAVFLIRDPLVLAELQLAAADEGPLAAFAASANEEAWKLRDLAPEAGVGSDAVEQLNELVESSLAKMLSAGQKERLEQIVVQVQGAQSIAGRKVADRLGLTGDQVDQAARLSAATQSGLKGLRAQVSDTKDRAELYRRAEKLRSDLARELLAVLTPAQRDRWTALQGKPVELTKLQMLTAQAPELRNVEAWINTAPLSFAQLRGQVVALHFWTFG
jgi:hypothetical protein